MAQGTGPLRGGCSKATLTFRWRWHPSPKGAQLQGLMGELAQAPPPADHLAGRIRGERSAQRQEEAWEEAALGTCQHLEAECGADPFAGSQLQDGFGNLADSKSPSEAHVWVPEVWGAAARVLVSPGLPGGVLPGTPPADVWETASKGPCAE